MNFIFAKLIYFLLICSLAKAFFVNPTRKEGVTAPPAGFWLSAELISVGFRKGCLSTALCHKPFFKLIHTMTLNSENMVMSWPLIDMEHQNRSFVTYWAQGDPGDISLSCQIAGTDPSFGFTRICDESPNRRIFNEAVIRQALAHHSLGTASNDEELMFKSRHYSNNNVEADIDGIAVELRGRCFNATIAIKKFQKRCPWCPDPNIHIVVGASNTGQASETFEEHHKKTDAFFLHNIIILALCGAFVFTVTCLCCVTFVHLRYRIKNSNDTTSRKRRGLKIVPGSGQKKKRTTLLRVMKPPQNLPVLPMNSHSMSTSQGQKMCLSGRKEHHLTCSDGRYEYETPWENCQTYQGSLVPISFPPNDYHMVASSVHVGTLGRNFPVLNNHANVRPPLPDATEVPRPPTCRLPPPPPMPLPYQHTSLTAQEKSSSSISRNDDSGLESI